ncbi:MAG: hypothetical protein QM820_14480 [Minicystis sp.]
MNKISLHFDVDLPEGIVPTVDELRVAAAVNLHGRGRLTLEDAARVAGLAPAGFVAVLDRLREHAPSQRQEVPRGVEPMGLVELIDSLSKRPGMWVGSSSLADIGHFLNGFRHAVSLMGLPDPLDAWTRWVELRFGVFSPAWHWTRILVHVFGSDEAAIAALPELCRSYLHDRDELGSKGIEAKLWQQATANPVCHEPEETESQRTDADPKSSERQPGGGRG